MPYTGDIGNIANNITATQRPEGGVTSARKKTDNTTLDMQDFLTLMVTQLQSQTLDSTTDTADMLNQMVQMTVISAINDITDATVMQYAGSLVGKEVTVARLKDGEYVLERGTVQASGTYGGEQVIYVNDERYKLSEIMSVGNLPESALKPEEDKTQDPNGTGTTDPAQNAGAAGAAAQNAAAVGANLDKDNDGLTDLEYTVG